ncbi:MAG: hypothetical protein WCK35_04695 [Chloroflexota bacterium]
MTANKINLSNLGSALLAMIAISLAGFSVLVLIVNELDKNGQALPSFLKHYFSFTESLQNNSGNELTGEITAWLFGISSIPVVFDLLLKTIIRKASFAGALIVLLQNIIKLQRKYLMPFHTWLSIAALGFGILHLALSACIANPFPELGLILTGILVITGLIFKWRAVSPLLRKVIYKFHSSLVVSGVLLVILYTGHAVMGSD